MVARGSQFVARGSQCWRGWNTLGEIGVAIRDETSDHNCASKLIFHKWTSSRSSPPPRGELERSIRSATPVWWVMAMDVTLVAGPPEIYGGGGTAFDGLF